MIVCVCHGISDRHVKAAIKDGATSIEALGAELGVATACGSCRETCGEMLMDAGCATSCHTAPRAVWQLMPIAA